MDLFDLKVVGWSYGLYMTDDLVIEAFNKALINRGLKEKGIFIPNEIKTIEGLSEFICK